MANFLIYPYLSFRLGLMDYVTPIPGYTTAPLNGIIFDGILFPMK